MTDPVAGTRAAYDALAPIFSERNATIPPGVRQAAEHFVAALPPGSRVLDLGCGHGRDAAFLASRGLSVVGADLSPGMLAQARARTAAPLVEADMRAIPFAAASFAAVWCNAALLHLPKADAPAALAEMRRVLAPGGLLYVAVQQGDHERWDVSTWVAGADRFFARYAPDELGPLLEAAGLTPERFDRELNPDRTWLRYFARRQ